MEQEQILPWSHISMVTVFQFLDHFVVLLKHFSVGEGNCVHALQIVVVVFGKPVGGTDFGALEGLDVG